LGISLCPHAPFFSKFAFRSLTASNAPKEDVYSFAVFFMEKEEKKKLRQSLERYGHVLNTLGNHRFESEGDTVFV